MILCIPVDEDKNIKSPVSLHFGSAPFFLLVDTDSLDCRTIPNKNKDHTHARCQPLASLKGVHMDAVVVGGIGAGALKKLQARGLDVFVSEHATVDDAVQAFLAGTLQGATPHTTCAHHGTGHHHGQKYGRFVKVPGGHRGCGSHGHGGCDHDKD